MFHFSTKILLTSYAILLAMQGKQQLQTFLRPRHGLVREMILVMSLCVLTHTGYLTIRDTEFSATSV